MRVEATANNEYGKFTTLGDGTVVLTVTGDLPPPTDPDYSRVYGMRADTESPNAQFERAFYNRRLRAWGSHNQTVIVLMAALAQNA